METVGVPAGLLLRVVVTMLFCSEARYCAAAEVVHPVYPVKASPERIELLKRRVAPVMGMSEEEMVGLVPDRTGFRFAGCPNCDGGAQEGQLTWSVRHPHRVRCRYCGMVFPNETYPENQVMRVTNPVGEEVAYPYWEDEAGYRTFFSAKGWRQARVYFASLAQDLGELYQTTGERQYARRAVLILDAFARYYPGFLVSRDRAFEPKGFVLEPPYPIHGGKWGRWHPDEMPTDLVFAYDSICASGELERLAGETGADVRARIENEFFRGVIRHEQNYPTTYDNMSPRIYLGYAVIGRVLGDPGLVHEAVRRSRRLFELRFFVDGFWCEGSPGYHRATLERGMGRVFDALEGYSDPPGYVDPEDGRRFDDLDLEQEIPNLVRARRVLEICRYPDGRLVPVHDAWYGTEDLLVPERSVSTLLTGVGHAWLGSGKGEDQAQVHLHFSGGYGHEHADNLNLALFAKGQELLSDVGYTHTRYRSWSNSTLCHNTVVIDEQRQYTRTGRPRWDRGRAFEGMPSDGRVLAFEAGCGPVQWVEASGERSYPGLAQVYRRTVMLVEAGAGEVYVVDLFRVVGGSQHDWVMHGSADRDGRAVVSVPLDFYGEHLLPGVEVRYPENERDRGDAGGRNPGYAFFQNVSRAEVTDGVTVTFTVSESPVGIRTHLPALGGAEVFSGDAPSVRRAEENDALLDRYRMPIFLVRREGPAPLSSCFAAVHEPYEGAPFLKEVSVEAVEGGEDAVVLRVRHHGVTDHIVHRGRPDRGPLRVGDLCMAGEVGFVREREGVVEEMGLWGGTELRWRDGVLWGGGVYEGEVVGILRKGAGDAYDALRVRGELPEGEVLRGATAVVSFGDGATLGYGVVGVRRAGGEAHVVLESDPGISVAEGGMRYLFFPLREVAGGVRYRVRTSAFARVGEGGAEIRSVGKAAFSGSQ